jgi:hypothetical protein
MIGRHRSVRASCAALTLIGALAFISTSVAAERHAGYYHPIPATSETFRARAETLPNSDRKRRVLFVTEMVNQMMNNPYPPPFAMFAKGEHAQKLIITSLVDGGYNTLYRMRGLLAILTARARMTPLFEQSSGQDVLTFLDLLKLLGFEQITVTDGDNFAHRIYIE